MNDILGRELKDGDLCIGMAIGRNSHGMHIGVFKGSSVVYPSYNGTYLNKSCTSNTYLIENPTEQELAIKEQTLKLLKEEEEERKRKASIKTIPLSKLEVGGLYESNQGNHYIYLGKRKVIFNNGNVIVDETEGNCFAYVYYKKNETTDDEILDNMLTIYRYSYSHNIYVLKGNKKLIKMIKKFNLQFPLIKSISNPYFKDKKYTLTIE